MTALARHRLMGNSAFTAAALDASRATALQTYRTISISPHQKFDIGSPSPSTASTQAFSITNLGFKHTGPLRHQQTRHYMKYSGHITKTLTNKNGDVVTHKRNLNPKDAKKLFLSILAVLGLVVCMWFVLCYEIGNLTETVFGWIGRDISV